MHNLDKISTQDIADSLRSGIRSSQAHAAFGTDIVRLAFGRHSQGRIRHVSSVNRGLDCACFCPACSEALIARQGDKKAWHFAHANGSTCRDALSASFAAFLAQMITDGEQIALPDLEWVWGSSVSRRGLPDFTFEKARLDRHPQSMGYEVRARAPGACNDVRIVFRSVRGRHAIMPVPGEESVLEIDLLQSMEKLFADGRDLELNEEWVRHQIAHAAPRRWLYNAASQAMREKLEGERLRSHLAAFEELSENGAVRPQAREHSNYAEERLANYGLARYICSPEIPGERYLAPSPSGWRAEIFNELVLNNALGDPERSEGKPGFDMRDVVRLMPRRKMIKSVGLMRPLPEDDAIELGRHIPDLRKPIEVIEDYLVWLWELDVIRPRPGLMTRFTEGALVQSDEQAGKLRDWTVQAEIARDIRDRHCLQ